MGGRSESEQSTQTQSQTQPWAPAIPGLQGVLSGVTAQLPNATPSAAENQAYGQLQSTAQAGNPYAGAIGNAANYMLSGGPDVSGPATSAYGTLQSQLTPWASGAMGDPRNNPALAQMLETIRNDVGNTVNPMFAAAGRDMSGANQMALARGIAQGEAPVLMQAQGMGLQAANSLYGAGANTTGILGNLMQLRAGMMGSGAGMADAANNASIWGPSLSLATGQQQRLAPLQGYGQMAGILGPIAGLGGTSSGTSNTQGSQTMSPAQQAWGWINAFANLRRGFGGGGGGLPGLPGVTPDGG